MNAPAIQAIAAAVSAVVTAVLVAVTWWYTRLMHRLARVASQQLQWLEADRAAQAAERNRSLLSLIAHLRALTASCPSDRSQPEKMEAVTLWSDTDLVLLRSLAVSFGTTAATLATEAARNLAVISELMRQSRKTPLQQSVNWERFDWVRWFAAIHDAERSLTALADIGLAQRDEAQRI